VTALVTAATLGVAGCGGGEGDGAAAPSTTPSTTAPSTTTTATTMAPAPERELLRLAVDGLDRVAVVDAAPSELDLRPLVFVFHGHGGSGPIAERNFAIHELWPDAVVVYPSGLPTVGLTDPEGERPGWQTEPGEYADRDLHFVDALLADVTARYPVDSDRTYLMGHSNGARFAALVWSERPGVAAAVATSSAQAGPLLAGAEPVPLFMSMGEVDPIVPVAAQRLSIEPARELLGIDPATEQVDGYLTTARGAGDLELATYIHPGGHEMPAEVRGLIVAFFQRHPG
jgi:polyhydroxybutyrate depolymerase